MFEGVSVPEHVVSSPMKLEHGCRGHLLVYEAHIVRLHFLQEFILLQQLYSVTGMSGGGEYATQITFEWQCANADGGGRGLTHLLQCEVLAVQYDVDRRGEGK